MRVAERMARLEFEARIAQIAASEMALGLKLSTEDHARLAEAAVRIGKDRAWICEHLTAYYARAGRSGP